jgi:hypothetical protein
LSYVNCGDWVDSCTAIVEHDDGSLELIAWGSSGQIESEPDRQPDIQSEVTQISPPQSKESACVS